MIIISVPNTFLEFLNILCEIYDCMTPSSSDDIYYLPFGHDVTSDVRMLPIKKHKKIKEPNLVKPNLS